MGIHPLLLERKRVRHGARFFLRPRRGIKRHLVHLAEIFVFERAVRAGVVKYFFGDFHVLEAVFLYAVTLARLPPLQGLQPVGGFVLSQRRFRDRVQLKAPPHCLLHLFHEINAFNEREVARVVFVEERNIKVVAVPPNERLRMLQAAPEGGQFFLEVAVVGIGCRIVDAHHCKVQERGIVPLHVGKEVARFYVKDNMAHTR